MQKLSFVLSVCHLSNIWFVIVLGSTKWILAAMAEFSYSMSKKTITKLEIQKSRKNRVSIFLNGEFAFGIDQAVALEWQLREGTELSEKTIEQIQVAEEKRKAKEQTFRWLAYRNRSSKELDLYRRLSEAFGDFLINICSVEFF